MRTAIALASIGLLAAAAHAAPAAAAGALPGTLPVAHVHGVALGMPGAGDEPASRRGEREQRRDDHARAKRDRDDKRSERGMQVVANDAGPSEPAYGWRYFTDVAAHRAVVISPQGEYYYSRGKGLRLVAVAPPAA